MNLYKALFLIFMVDLNGPPSLQAQDTILYNPKAQYDITDLVKKIFSSEKKASGKAPSTISLLPSIGYNPSIGFQIGMTITGGKYFGANDSTTLSVFAITGFVTTKGIVSAQFRHNLFTAGNEWNFQGNWQFSRITVLDYGPGSGIVIGTKGEFSINGLPLNNDSATFPIRFRYIRFTERVYRAFGKHFYAGLGLSFDIRSKINDYELEDRGSTPHYVYSLKNGFDTLHYSANGLLINIQSNTKEHPNRALGGTYLDLGFRVNQRWMGSTKNAFQLLTEVRKYIPLSKGKPRHILAFWHWGSFLLGGSIPYLELPGVGSDTYARSGRGYTLGAIKGLSFFYAETEYRFPISRNGFVGGVVFTNVQSASNQDKSPLFKYWNPAGGAGLRFLFNKYTRTNICIDYAFGRYGSNGLFFGLNEAF